MATIILGAAGAALGAGFGGAVAGLSGAAIGRAFGATVGRALDQRLLGSGSDPVEVGRLNSLSITNASEGARVARSWGRMRLPGQIIWASDFIETRRTTGSGKGAPQPKAVNFSYSVSLAIALCEGEILGVGRVWADGKELPESSLDMRVYLGTETQLPDPLISIAHGFDSAPAFRGTAYIIFENLSLEQFGNRVPQFNFEVLRKAQSGAESQLQTYQDIIKAVAIIPGTGECALSTKKVSVQTLFGERRMLNVNNRSEEPDFVQSMKQMSRELPECQAVSLVISWFGDDLRCDACSIKPKSSLAFPEGSFINQPMRLGGVEQALCERVAEVDGRPIYGGTPSDESILEAIEFLKGSGKEIMFYPFILMEQTADNSLPDPYSDEQRQPALPWRGRITLHRAPGQTMSSVGTSAARQEVEEFFGVAQPNDFEINGRQVKYHGPSDWGYRRFVLHNAHLVSIAGGVESFCIGSEMRGLTTILGENNTFPAVEALVQLANDVREILGSEVKISYAADWTEYFGFHRGKDVYFHLDQLWASPSIDFIGIDNYMPISDWRSGQAHLDHSWRSIYNLEYLSSNVRGGEGFDWWYDGQEARDYQRRSLIVDEAHGEDWIFRYKDIANWWCKTHHERIGGIRQIEPTGWVPKSKPIRFTEYGCAAVDKGTNDPNRFNDIRSSEASLPNYSTGERDDFLQLQYYRAVNQFWDNEQNNPPSDKYSGRMIDLSHCYAWSWDSRPFPEFPRNSTLWEDGGHWSKGHWLNGRCMLQPLDAVLSEVCEQSGVGSIDVSQVFGGVLGYSEHDQGVPRATIQPLSLVFSFDAIESEGCVGFLSRGVNSFIEIEPDLTVVSADNVPNLQIERLGDTEVVRSIRLGYITGFGDFRERMVEVLDSSSPLENSSYGEFTGILEDDFASSVTRRWLIEAGKGRDRLTMHLPRSLMEVDAGAVVRLNCSEYRVDRVELGDTIRIEATLVDLAAYDLKEVQSEIPEWEVYQYPAHVRTFFLDIPSASASPQLHAPFVVASAESWSGSVGVWQGLEDADYQLLNVIDGPTVAGVLDSPLKKGSIGLFDNHSAFSVRLTGGTLESCSKVAVLGGKNIAAIGDGSPDKWEIIQFQTADLIGYSRYNLSGLIRGQLGTDGFAKEEWPKGSVFVLLNDVDRLNFPETLRNVEIDLRTGSLAKGPEEGETELLRTSFAGNGLRPYSVCHFRTVASSLGELVMSWTRRTRLGGDDWNGSDVPLSEEREAYLLKVRTLGGSVVRSVELREPRFAYSLADRAADGVSGEFNVEIAQISATYGPGTWRSFSVFD